MFVELRLAPPVRSSFATFASARPWTNRQGRIPNLHKSKEKSFSTEEIGYIKFHKVTQDKEFS